MGGYPAALSRCRYFSKLAIVWTTVAMLAIMTAIFSALPRSICVPRASVGDPLI